MALVPYLVTKTPRGGDQRINGIQAMLLTIDDAVDTTNAAIRARAVAVARANGQELTPNYFDTAVTVASLSAAVGNCQVFGTRVVSVPAA